MGVEPEGLYCCESIFFLRVRVSWESSTESEFSGNECLLRPKHYNMLMLDATTEAQASAVRFKIQPSERLSRAASHLVLLIKVNVTATYKQYDI